MSRLSMISRSYGTLVLCIPFLLVATCADADLQSQNGVKGHEVSAGMVSSERAEPPALPKIDRDKEERERRAFAEYQAKLRDAPEYSSPIRNWLIDNATTYELTGTAIYMGHLSFWKANYKFNCIHDPAVIRRAEKDGWQLVSCSEDSAVFFRKYKRNIPQCKTKRRLPELFEALEIFKTLKNDTGQEIDIVNSWGLLITPSIPRRTWGVHRKITRPIVELHRPIVEEVGLNHYLVRKYVPKLKLSPNIIMLAYNSVGYPKLAIFDTKRLQDVTFYHKPELLKCERPTIGILTGNSITVRLTTFSNDYGEIEEMLGRSIKYGSGVVK